MTTFHCMYCEEEKHYTQGIVIQILIGEYNGFDAFLCDDCYNKYRGKY